MEEHSHFLCTRLLCSRKRSLLIKFRTSAKNYLSLKCFDAYKWRVRTKKKKHYKKQNDCFVFSSIKKKEELTNWREYGQYRNLETKRSTSSDWLHQLINNEYFKLTRTYMLRAIFHWVCKPAKRRTTRWMSGNTE